MKGEGKERKLWRKRDYTQKLGIDEKINKGWKGRRKGKEIEKEEKGEEEEIALIERKKGRKKKGRHIIAFTHYTSQQDIILGWWDRRVLYSKIKNFLRYYEFARHFFSLYFF